MFLKNRLLIIGSCVMAALLFSFSWVGTALAAGVPGDGDEDVGDGLMWPWPLLVIGGMIMIGIITYFVLQRRSRS